MTRRLLIVVSCGLMALAASTMSSFAAGAPGQQAKPLNWQQRDTAIYVVSTLNVLRSPNGQLLVSKLDVARYDVYDDLARQSLYFIQLRSDDGSQIGAVAYQMGWPSPRSLSRSTARLGIRRAPRDVWHAYRTDAKQLIGSFTTTTPVS